MENQYFRKYFAEYLSFHIYYDILNKKFFNFLVIFINHFFLAHSTIFVGLKFAVCTRVMKHFIRHGNTNL